VRARCRIPKPDRFVPRSRCERAAVGREGYGVDRTAMPFERLQVRARCRIPKPDRVVPRSRRERPAVGREGYGADRTAMPLERLQVHAPVFFDAGDYIDKW